MARKKATKEEDNFRLQFGVRLQRIRKNIGIKQDTMARNLGISVTMYGYYEAGKCSVPLEKILPICDMLNTSPNQLLGYGDEQAVNNLCELYDIKHKIIDANTVEVTTGRNNLLLSKDLFYEIVLNVDKHMKNTIIASEGFDNIRNTSISFANTYLDLEINRVTKPPYTEKQMLKDLKRLDTSEKDIGIIRKSNKKDGEK